MCQCHSMSKRQIEMFWLSLTIGISRKQLPSVSDIPHQSRKSHAVICLMFNLNKSLMGETNDNFTRQLNKL